MYIWSWSRIVIKREQTSVAVTKMLVFNEYTPRDTLYFNEKLALDATEMPPTVSGISVCRMAPFVVLTPTIWTVDATRPDEWFARLYRP